jgi:hypothetical protein
VFTGELGEEVAVGTYVETWLRSEEAKAFIPASGNNGTGAQNQGGGGGGGLKNPWAKDTFNLTEQGTILKSDPALAKRLKAAAGK